jgi:metal transporter CNNM
LHPKLQNQEHQHGNLSHEELEFLSASDEEVIGVITLEDVMEELIQVMNKLSFS